MKYRAEIDGLRAIAVLPVILMHAGFDLFSGGFVGVDVFFVISGYLITTILIDDIENKRFNIFDFYERRARRILPALFFMMLVCIPFAWAWMLPSQAKDFSQSIAAVSLFVSNILFWHTSGYFEAASEEKPLLHTWSLAVEEQYYVLFPIFLLLAWRSGRDKLIWIIIFFSAISLVFSEWGSRNYPAANFYLAPSRVWELLSGSLAAFLVHKHGVKGNEIFSIVGLSAIVFSIFAFDDSIPFPGFYALVPVLGTVLLILYADTSTIVAKLLSMKYFVSVGLISYSAYLWHQPLFAFVRIRLLDEPLPLMMALLVIMSLLLATFSWKYIERPFRGRTSIIQSRATIFSFSLGGILIFVTLGFIGDRLDGFEYRFSKILSADVGHDVFYEYIDRTYVDCEPQSIAKSSLNWNGVLRCKQSRVGDSDWVLLGDSHAEHLFLGMAESNIDKNIAFYIFGGKPYLNNSQFAEIFKTLYESERSKKVFLTMRFATRVDTDFDLFSGFDEVVRFLKKIGHEVVILGDIPAYSVDPEKCMFTDYVELAMRYCSKPRKEFESQRARFEPALEQVAKENNVAYIPLHSPLCDENTCSMLAGKTLLYRDDNHLNIAGSRLIGSYLSKKLNLEFAENW